MVHGQVQGVGYRASMAAEARRLGVAGWVRNRPDGTVEAQAEGPDDALAALASWARSGPRFADVERVDERESSAEGATDFTIAG
ncbi:acylphosphatase [Cellulomonas pakistanensis]|uniref:acylphosphatase n=1 Tax=Cellulomonas pakistanensis TaxID=992287 RepID=A0A919PE11_9CELL|nr:acylphosphatase [Cellulomonas pakistanensis]